MKYLFITLFLILPFGAMSQVKEYTLLEPLPCVENTGNDVNCDTETNTITKVNTQTYIQYLYRFSFSFAVALAIVMIILGGFQYALSDAVFSKGEARERITNAFIGLIMLFGSYVILETIDPRLIEVKTELDPIEAKIEKVNYGQFFGEIDTAEMNRKLSDAMNTDKQLKEQATKLKQEAEKEKNPEEKAKKLNEAKKLEYEAKLVTSKATAAIAVDKSLTGGYSYQNEEGERIIIGYLANISDQPLDEKIMQEEKENIGQLIDKNINEIKASGDVEGVQVMQQEKKYQLTRYDEIAFLTNQLRKVDSKISIFGFAPARDAESKKALEAISNKPLVTDGLSAKQVEELRKQRNTYISKIDEIANK